ncbi:MAG: glycosyltransferase [Anaerolineae bacterium]|nr:glycosyltransferase [Anaerolineae bacterium]
MIAGTPGLTQTTGREGLLSVVIPNWNGLKFLETCLNALAAQTHSSIETILVDNASDDGSLAYIRERYPWVRLIALGENRGFTGACNAGMQAAQGEFICLLNNDTEAEPGWAAAVVDAFRRHPQIGSVASKMRLFEKRDHLHTAGDFFTRDGRPGNRGVWERDEGQYDREEFVFSACGGSAVYRRAMLSEIGLLDDDFFFSLEDVDLGWRAQLAGWRCLYTPAAVVYHHLSATGGGVTASYFVGRNTIYLLVKDFPLWHKYGWRVVQGQAQTAWEALRAWRGDAARARLRGMAAGVRGIPLMRRKRRQIMAQRRLSDAEVEQLLSA